MKAVLIGLGIVNFLFAVVNTCFFIFGEHAWYSIASATVSLGACGVIYAVLRALKEVL